MITDKKRGGEEVFQIIPHLSRKRFARGKRAVDPTKLFDDIGHPYNVRGTRLWAPCPNPEHKEKNPSFTTTLDPTEERYGKFHCFGCGWHGDVYDLLISIKIVPDLYSAYQWVYARYGAGSFASVEDVYSLDWASEVGIRVNRGLRLPDVYKTGNISSFPNRYRSYLESRKVLPWQVTRHGIGYVSPRSVCDSDVCSCGRRSGGRDQKYCRFSDRIIFPVVSNGVIADIQGRSINSSTVPKMMTPFGSRTPALFGHELIDYNEDYVIIVEGPFDNLAVEACGYKNVVSVLTSRILPEHANLLENITTWILVPDTDEGASKDRINTHMIETALQYRFDHEIYLAIIHPGTDPAREWEEGRSSSIISALERPKRLKKEVLRPSLSVIY